MQIADKIIVVTGAGSGIGKALAARFVADGAQAVIAVDRNPGAAQAAAVQYGCLAMTADVGRESDIRRVIDDTEHTIGPIDLFCSNAGVALGASEQSPDAEWLASWDVNVMAHVYAARHLLPRMLERGGGYLLNTASAAGLLSQPDGAAYAVTKHAAVAFAEWLAMTYAHRGLRVSVLCPQAVRTNMTADTTSTATRAAATDGMMEPDALAAIVVEHLSREAFLILTHPQVREYVQKKAADHDRWIQGMNRFYRTLTGPD